MTLPWFLSSLARGDLHMGKRGKEEEKEGGKKV